MPQLKVQSHKTRLDALNWTLEKLSAPIKKWGKRDWGKDGVSEREIGGER